MKKNNVFPVFEVQGFSDDHRIFIIVENCMLKSC